LSYSGPLRSLLRERRLGCPLPKHFSLFPHRFASDHVPLLVTASSSIPRGSGFHFENTWLRSPAFSAILNSVLSAHFSGATAASFTKRLKNCRRACRAWARRQRPLEERAGDTKTLIAALDLLEEERPLSDCEAKLRTLATQSLQNIHTEQLTYWRQRFNLRIAVEWDENSRFFHAAASGRRRKNLITCLEHEGQTVHAHDGKANILYNFYRELLGTSRPVLWAFNLSTLYPFLAVDGSTLSAPFSSSEIVEALFSMDRNSSPGPDGFGPSFYRAFWPALCGAVEHLCADFHNGTLHLDGLNRALLVLIPKKDGARTADAFRPISLQNCPMKLFSKMMVNRLKPVIPSIIDPDQTGFVHGRSISENFIYAADLLSCCFKQELPTVVLKLDFRKAFDSVEWASLDTILAARGFDDRWRSWISCILNTGKTAIKLNGVPGHWLTCRRGLRQGDPLSPYLFIIVADVLQRLIRHASNNGLISHPVDQTLPCASIRR